MWWLHSCAVRWCGKLTVLWTGTYKTVKIWRRDLYLHITWVQHHPHTATCKHKISMNQDIRVSQKPGCPGILAISMEISFNLLVHPKLPVGQATIKANLLVLIPTKRKDAKLVRYIHPRALIIRVLHPPTTSFSSASYKLNFDIKTT